MITTAPTGPGPAHRPPVTYRRTGSVGVITLDRPEVSNAYDRAMLDALARCWREAAGDPAARVVLVTATGRHFCAGHDVREVVTPDSPPDPGPGAYWAWREVPKPTIAVVQGRCISGGLLIAWTCDLILAAEDATFSDVLVRYGMGGVLYHGHTWELGARRAKEMLFTAEPVTARDAMALGMVNRVVAADELLAEALALATRIARHDPAALADAKAAVHDTLDAQGQARLRERFERLFAGYVEPEPQDPRTA